MGRILSFSSEKRHMKHSCLHVQTREKLKQQLRFVVSYNCHSLYCENCYHSVVVNSITITAATGKVHVQPQAPVNNSLYTVNSQTQQLILHVLALLRKEKLGKKTKKSGEKTIT